MRSECRCESAKWNRKKCAVTGNGHEQVQYKYDSIFVVSQVNDGHYNGADDGIEADILIVEWFSKEIQLRHECDDERYSSKVGPCLTQMPRCINNELNVLLERSICIIYFVARSMTYNGRGFGVLKNLI